MDINQQNQNTSEPNALYPNSFRSSNKVDIKIIIIGILSLFVVIALGVFLYVYKTKISEVKKAREEQAKELTPLNDIISSLKTDINKINETTESLREEAIIAESVCMSNTSCRQAYNSGQHSLMELSPNYKPPYSPTQ